MSEQATYTEHIYQEYHYKDFDPIHQREEIVRCRDCESYQPEMYKHFTCEYLHCLTNPDDFCAWATRKERIEQ